MVVYANLWSINIEGSVLSTFGSPKQCALADPFGEIKGMDGRQYMRHLTV
jgi:hypothetical protein